MHTHIVAAKDSDFIWFLSGEPQTKDGLRLPPGGVDEPLVLAHVRAMAARLRSQGFTATWMIVSNHEVVGLCGFKQPPSPGGEVEIGYSVAAARRRRGHATRAVSAVVDIARRDPVIRLVTAKTAVTNLASQRVLEHNDFERAGMGYDPEDGEVTCWQLVVAT